MLSRMSAAEETGYQGTYFTDVPEAPLFDADGFIPSISPADSRPILRHQTETTAVETDVEGEAVENGSKVETPHKSEDTIIKQSLSFQPDEDEDIGEAVFFEYGVVVFFGLDVGQERSILDDIQGAEILRRPMDEDNWEIEECHFEAWQLSSLYDQVLTFDPLQHNPYIAHPRIYNDFFSAPYVLLPSCLII
jgi:uncharacterized Rmd1/YagE family protein